MNEAELEAYYASPEYANRLKAHREFWAELTACLSRYQALSPMHTRADVLEALAGHAAACIAPSEEVAPGGAQELRSFFIKILDEQIERCAAHLASRTPLVTDGQNTVMRPDLFLEWIGHNPQATGCTLSFVSAEPKARSLRT